MSSHSNSSQYNPSDYTPSYYSPQLLPNLQLLSLQETFQKGFTFESNDATVIIFNDPKRLLSAADNMGPVIGNAVKQLVSLTEMDHASLKDSHMYPANALPGGKLILSATGPLLRDYDDVRRYAEAASKAVGRIKAAGNIRKPVIFIQPPPFELMEGEVAKQFCRYLEVSMLAILAEQHNPLEARETLPDLPTKSIGEFSIIPLDSSLDASQLDSISRWVMAVEEGRRLARDIGGADPERMSSLVAAKTIRDYFSTLDKEGNSINVSIEDDYALLKKEYPLLAAVARASLHTPRHAPAVVHLDYRSPRPEQVQTELFMVGKGINYDTGGADIKYGGAMVGMSRDKCGAAALAGFMATIAKLRPNNVNVRISLAFVRNSIGSDSYVSDELIKSRAGCRVRVGNTDAEGRMVMADLLAKMKETALSCNAPHRSQLFTCATLTGHVGRAYGPYSAVIENGPARLLRIGESLKNHGQQIGDCFEISTMRREDFDFIAPKSACEDVIQANSLPSTMTNRGHQYPAAFLTIASGLSTHGLDAPISRRLPYCHLDIASSAVEKDLLGRITGSPIPALAATFLK